MDNLCSLCCVQGSQGKEGEGCASVGSSKRPVKVNCYVKAKEEGGEGARANTMVSPMSSNVDLPKQCSLLSLWD